MVPLADLEKLIAWAAAERLAMFPIPAWQKRPLGLVRSHKTDWSKDFNQWRRWHSDSRGCNFGIECGPSGLIVVDPDADELGRSHLDLYAEWEGDFVRANVLTPRGGRHCYYQVPDGIDANELRQPDIIRRKVNVRAGAGYVVAPWSVTRKSEDCGEGAYKLVYAVIPPASAKLLAHCQPTKTDAAKGDICGFDGEGLPASPIDRMEAAGRLAAILERLGAAGRGERNNRLNEAAFELGKLIAAGKLTPWRAESDLQMAGESLALGRDEVRATIRSGLRAGRSEPCSNEPRSALAALLAAPVPIQPVTIHIRQRPVSAPANTLPEPIVERLLSEGTITTLSGASGTGKTTLGASLMAASVADLRDMKIMGSGSNVLCRPAAWVYVCYEGGQHMKRAAEAWRRGTEMQEKFPQRQRLEWADEGCLICTVRREVVVNQKQAAKIARAIDETGAANPGRPLVVVVDNIGSAVEDPTDNVQAQLLMRTVRAWTNAGVAALLLTHPPKSNGSAIYGASAFFNLADTVGKMTVLNRQDGSWTQWIDFEKHREAMSGESLEIKSRRLDHPIQDLPPGWGGDNELARARMIRNLHIPYVYSIKVRPESEKTIAGANVLRGHSSWDKPIGEN